MTIPQLLSIIGLACLIAAAALATRYLRLDRGLRRAFIGLLLSAVAGVAIAFSKSPVLVWSLAPLMLGGVIFMVLSLHADQKRKNQKPA